MAGVQAWTGYQAPVTSETRAEAYAALWSLFDGTAFNAAWRRKGVFQDQRVYRNTRLLSSHVESSCTFYAMNVYAGNLPTDGKRLPDGSQGAIPLDPQTGNDASDQALLTATSQLWARWNWQEGMSLRPLYGAVLGSVLTELIDDPARHAAWPQLIWPGFVVEHVLDAVGNLKRYVLEYPIVLVEHGQQRTYRYRKEVDTRTYRYFRDDQPWTDTGPGGHGDAEQENPYGFVPAIWDRHRNIGEDYGLSAIAGTRQALTELNSVLSHGMDYQRKAFSAPVLIKGGMQGSARNVIGPGRNEDPSQLAESLGFREVGENAGIEQLNFDIGKTLDILAFVKQGILEANPEASFYHELRAMSQLTGPAVERALGDAVGRVNLARAGYDAQSVKLFQMAIAMCGFRLNSGDWGSPSAREAVFKPYNLDSFASGALDMTILGRPVVPQTESERVDLIARKEQITTQDGLMELGYSKVDAERIIAERTSSLYGVASQTAGAGL